ncbi:hypothetical protein [Halorussus halophilus]|uniref:hypothetical protein n=1 Tax=Halorussus halophilus TaxID=2650975 RepID=UPI001CE42A8E|nr:hypothetical protein [Halorussus halophilus]
MTGNRTRVAGALLLAIFGVLVGLAFVGLVPRVPSTPMYFLFSAIIGGNLTLITVVLSINQLVLSRELGAPGDLNRRIREAVKYRDQVADTTNSTPIPYSPADFLLHLHETLTDQAIALRESTSPDHDERLNDRVADLVGSLTSDAENVTRTLDTTAVDIFAVIEATLGTNHAEQLYEITAIEAEFDQLTDEQRRLLEQLHEQLLHIDTARKYYRTIYVEKELSLLSRVLLYVGVPAEVLSAILLAIYGAIGSGPPAPDWLLPLALVTTTFGFAPLAILFAYVLRLSWVAQLNTSIAPFSATKDDSRL